MANELNLMSYSITFYPSLKKKWQAEEKQLRLINKGTNEISTVSVV